MAFRDLFEKKKFAPLIATIVIAVAAYVGYEFKILKRPVIPTFSAQVAEAAAPEFGLANVTFSCATQRGFVTNVRLNGKAGAIGVSEAACDAGFIEQTTRCPSGLPMAGFGDQIKCSQGESIHCHGGPLQTLGLFKDDSFCGDVSDRDMGPPQDAPRAED